MFEILDTINTTIYKDVQSKKLSQSGSIEVLHISLEIDAVLKKHSSPKDALLIVLEGCISFHINNNTYDLNRHQIFNFAKGVEHWVEAHENSNVLVIR